MQTYFNSFFMMCLMLLVPKVWAVAVPEVIYGDDDRVNVLDSPSLVYQSYAKPVAAMIKRVYFSMENKKSGKGVLLSGPLYGPSNQLCSDEKFYNEISVSHCSGFLISPSKLLTAGHCVKSTEHCQNYYWVFDYVYSPQNYSASEYVGNLKLESKNIYSCKNVIKRMRVGDKDFALIELSKPVMDRTPLKINKTGDIAINTPLVLVGSPAGLPLKIAANAWVSKNTDNDSFAANLDAFGGNSGSPVINALNGEVEGVLIRGNDDFYDRVTEECKRVKRCDDVIGCSGRGVEVVARARMIYEQFKTMPDFED